jgi:hypothetical protein
MSCSGVIDGTPASLGLVPVAGAPAAAASRRATALQSMLRRNASTYAAAFDPNSGW